MVRDHVREVGLGVVKDLQVRAARGRVATAGLLCGSPWLTLFVPMGRWGAIAAAGAGVALEMEAWR